MNADDTLLDLVESTEHHSPLDVAVRCGGSSFSYAEVHARAEVLARRLAAFDVSPDTIVGVCLERSLELVVALLAVIKAGGAFLPLDPDWPDARLEALVNDANPRLIISDKRLAPRLGARTCIYVDGDSFAVPLLFRPKPHDLAYVIYTSGSTGEPKGVMIPHQGIANRLVWMQQQFALTKHDRVLHKTSIGFDPSIWEVFWPLLVGAAVVVAAPGAHRDLAILARTIRNEEVTDVHFVPSVLGMFLDEPEAAVCHSLRRVFVSGEALPPAMVRRALQILPGELHNLYGPTETSIDVCHWKCVPLAEDQPTPIGRPIRHTCVHLLDEAFRAIPTGAIGEICIGGSCVGRGYLGRPDLTAKSFFQDPFDSGRLYRTGDLGRWDSQGLLEFHGRADDQIKLGGVRIEPLEVETAIRSHHDVRAAAVICCNFGNGSVLTAFLVMSGEAALASDRDLARAVGSRLPSAMVPTRWLRLSSLPLTSNGKVDRTRLVEIARNSESRSLASEYDPKGGTVAVLTSLFAEALGVQAISPLANFFEAGGDSLRAMRLLSRIRRDLAAALTFAEFVRTPTAAAIVARIDLLRSREPEVSIPRSLRNRNIGASAAQVRLWLTMQLDANTPAYNLCQGLRFESRILLDPARRALDELVCRHEALHTTFTLKDDQVNLVVNAVRPMDIEVIELPYEKGENANRVLELFETFAARPFELSTGPLVRAAIILCNRTSALALSAHHIVVDGASYEILLDEWVRLYEAFSQGRPSPLPPSDLQPADVAEWESNAYDSATTAAQLSWWRAHLAPPVAPFALPADRPRPPTKFHKAELIEFQCDETISATLSRVCSLAGATQFMGLLAVTAAWLGRLAAVEDVVVAVPWSRRTLIELESVVDYLLDTLPIRCNLSGDPCFLELLGRTRSVVLGASEHRAVTFDTIVREFAPRRRGGSTPFLDVMLVVQGAPRQFPAGVLPFEVSSGCAKYDLKLDLAPSPIGWRGLLEVSADLFSLDRAFRMASQFVGLLEEAVRRPEERFSRLAPREPTLVPPPSTWKRLFV